MAKAYAKAAVHLAAAFETILEPWLEGREDLDLETLRAIKRTLMQKVKEERDGKRNADRYE